MRTVLVLFLVAFVVALVFGATPAQATAFKSPHTFNSPMGRKMEIQAQPHEPKSHALNQPEASLHEDTGSIGTTILLPVSGGTKRGTSKARR